MHGCRLTGLALAIGSVAFASTGASAGGWGDCRHGDCARYAPAVRYHSPPVYYYPPPVIYYVPPPVYYAPPPVAYRYYGPAGPIRYYWAPPAYGYTVRPTLFDTYYRYPRRRRW